MNFTLSPLPAPAAFALLGLQFERRSGRLARALVTVRAVEQRRVTRAVPGPAG